MAKRKPKKKEFRITVKNSSLPEEEKRELLWQCFDILLCSSSKKEKEHKHQEK